jgi:hypothetical protein
MALALRVAIVVGLVAATVPLLAAERKKTGHKRAGQKRSQPKTAEQRPERGRPERQPVEQQRPEQHRAGEPQTEQKDDRQAQPPVSPQEVEELRRRIERERRSQAELFFDGHAESGDLNSRLGYQRYGLRATIRRGETTLLISALRTPYGTIGDVLSATATSVTAGARRRLSDTTEGTAELGLSHFETGTTTATALAAVTVRPWEKLRYSVALARLAVEESFLSAVGIRPAVGPFAGERVGPVMESRLDGSASYRLPEQFDVFAEAAVGRRAGANVPSNFFRRAGLGLGYNAIVRAEDQPVTLVRVSASVHYFGFDDDRFGYGGASLLDAAYQPLPVEGIGSDGLPTEPAPGVAGVGGYFSPRRFVSRVGRVQVRGRRWRRLDYDAALFLGTQDYTGTSTRLAVGASADLVLQASERLSFPVSWAWDNVGPYRQHTLVARLRARF